MIIGQENLGRLPIRQRRNNWNAAVKAASPDKSKLKSRNRVHWGHIYDL